MAMLTTPARSHMTPDNEPKMSTMVTAELPTSIDVTLMKVTGEGPGVRTAQKSSAKQEEDRDEAEPCPSRNAGAGATKTSTPTPIMISPKTMLVQWVEQRQGAEMPGCVGED